MNILLANMPIGFNRKENLEPPLGICYLASMVKDLNGVNVSLKDYEIERFSRERLAEEIAGIDILGVSFRTASYRSAKQFISMAKDLKKNLRIVIGGHHATAFPKETLEDMGADIAVIGEGEYTLKEVVERLSGNFSMDGVEGVAYKNTAGGITVNRPRPSIKDIDALPLPARELLDIGKYSVITILTSRGCPFNCIYCDKGVSTREVKFRSADRIFAEIDHIVTGLGKNRIYVVDDHFFLKKERLEPILDRIIEKRLPVRWICQARVDGISEDILRKAKEAGCEQIMYGIETGDEDELKYMRKGSSLEQAQRAVELTKKAGITVRANFMLGFPISTSQTMRNTIRFARKIKPDIVRFFAVSPLPNTDLWSDIYGIGHKPDNVRWEDINFYNPSFDIKAISRKDVSLYVTVGYWHVLKIDFIKEVTTYLFPNIFRLLLSIIRTGRLRGNISKSFPRSVNLILDNMHQLHGKSIGESIRFLRQVFAAEKAL